MVVLTVSECPPRHEREVGQKRYIVQHKSGGVRLVAVKLAAGRNVVEAVVHLRYKERVFPSLLLSLEQGVGKAVGIPELRALKCKGGKGGARIIPAGEVRTGVSFSLPPAALGLWRR